MLDLNRINLFVDASTCEKRSYSSTKNFISCAGAILVEDHTKIAERAISKSEFEILDNSTNNIGELYAIFLAVRMAHMLFENEDINIFSDSRISVFGLREWMDTWYRSRDSNGIFHTYYNKKEVANQWLLKLIMYFIAIGSNRIHLYCQKGHVNSSDYDMLHSAMCNFKDANYEDIDMKQAADISFYNNIVDVTTSYRLSYRLGGDNKTTTMSDIDGVIEYYSRNPHVITDEIFEKYSKNLVNFKRSDDL